MATISNITICSGGNHVHFTVTTSRGSRRVMREMPSLRAAIAESSLEDFIISQLASLIRANPGLSPLQLRNLIQSHEFLE